MRSWIPMVVASIALASPAPAQEELMGRAEARRSEKARLEQEHAHRIEIAKALAEQQAAMRRDVLRTAATLAPPMDASQLASELRPVLPGRPGLPRIERVAQR